jgi:hypothetical protein
MSTAPPGNSRAVTWTLLLLAIPLFYLLTVPVVKVLIIQPKWTRISVHGPKTHGWAITKPHPDWLVTYCDPYHWLIRTSPIGIGPALERYHEWCFKVFGK